MNKISLAILLILFSLAIITADDAQKTSQEVLQVLEEEDTAKVIISFENTTKIKTAEISESSLKALESQKAVESIELEKPFKLSLQDTIGIINASISWPLQQAGINFTGLNQTICILDSGVNASHPALTGRIIHQYCYCSISEGASSNCCPDGTSEDFNASDNNGHGTHVSGIAAASTLINGIAPQANIVIIKVTNSSGDGVSSDLVKGINYCVNNVSLFNISVISMSLGGSSYTTFCDGDFPSSSEAINAAIDKNISVLAASGNSGSSTAISWPACIYNATAIGATGKDDTIASYSNRNNLTKLFAPGGTGSGSTAVNSTCISSDSATGYCGKAGTSMSTPHVAGAIAVINQFLNITSRTRTPKQITAILNTTGKQFTEGANNFSRINLYSAIISLDNSVPVVSLSTPSTGFASGNQNQTFICNSTDLALKNVTFFLYNSSSIFNSSSRNVSGASTSQQFNVTNMTAAAYSWNCLYVDENSNLAIASSNFSITIENVVVSLKSPANNLATAQNQTFTCNATSTVGLANVTFQLYNSSSIENTASLNSTGTANSTSFSFNFTHQDSYSWNCLYTSNASSLAFASSNFSLTYDLAKPSITLNSPTNSSFNNKLDLNITLSENGTCLYSLDRGIINISLSSLNNQNFNGTNSTLSQGNNHNLTYYCNDTAGNTNSSFVNFNIDLTKPNVSSISPADGYSETSASATLTFNYNVTDNLNISNCSLLIGNGINITNSSSINQSLQQNLTQTFTPAAYSWQVNCTDIAGNIGNSSLRTFTISSPPVQQTGGGSGGGSGGGGSTAGAAAVLPSAIAGRTFFPSSEQLASGYSNEFKEKDKILFSLPKNQELHALEIKKILENSLNITISSDTINFIINTGEEKSLDLNKNNFSDFYIKLDAMQNGTKANLTIKSVAEPLSEGLNETKKLPIAEIPKISPGKAGKIILVLVLIVVLGRLIIFVYNKIKNDRQETKIKEQIRKVSRKKEKIIVKGRYR